MSDQHTEPDSPKATQSTHSTNFHAPVSAQAISTGSGDINITGMVNQVGAASSKEDFLEALRAFKHEVENARQKGLPEDTSDDVIVELEAVEREMEKEEPQPVRVTKRLENAKNILLETAGVATAATTAAAATGQLVPFLEQAIQTAGKLFGG